jgi:hypothetical protein
VARAIAGIDHENEMDGAIERACGWIGQAVRAMSEAWRSQVLPEAFHTSDRSKDRYPLDFFWRVVNVCRLVGWDVTAHVYYIADLWANGDGGKLKDFEADSLVSGSDWVARVPS